MKATETLSKLGMTVPEILLPREGIDLTKWAVIACDQYTSEREYWEEVRGFTGTDPSTLNLIFPECFLQDKDAPGRITAIHRAMSRYEAEGVFAPPLKGFILVKRETPETESRWGLMTALDLEAYDYTSESASLVRATEGTILDRIPPRKRIRKAAPLELPHIMVLLDDPEGLVVETIQKEVISASKPVYDFDLMFHSGHITGYGVTDPAVIESLAEGLSALWERQRRRDSGKNVPLLYAVGDGNHSLATAKAIWEDIKGDLSPKERENHPARFALVELVNLYDRGITFEPIHRVLFGTHAEQAREAMEGALGRFRPLESAKALTEAVKNPPPGQPTIGVAHGAVMGTITLKNTLDLPTGQVQDWIDSYVKEGKADEVDYIHGDEATLSLGKNPDSLGILLPAIGKDSFFQTILNRGAFPRKTFSMGEAHEKRFYLEARRILPDSRRSQ